MSDADPRDEPGSSPSGGSRGGREAPSHEVNHEASPARRVPGPARAAGAPPRADGPVRDPGADAAGAGPGADAPAAAAGPPSVLPLTHVPSSREGGAEPPPPTEGETYDVLVLGAGMAGLSAAHALMENDLEVLVVEARDRLGGRTWTDRTFAGFPLELGAEFIHGERAATWGWVERLGLHTVPWEKLDDSWVRTVDGRRLTMREARAADPAFDLTRSWELPDVAAWPNEDFGSYLRRVGFDAAQLEYVRRAFANAAGESLRHLDARSVLDGFEARELDGRREARIVEGYGAIVEALGLGPDIDTGTVARRVYWGPAGVTVETDGGPVYQARAAVLTLPVGVLQAGSVRFVPELPEGKRRALAGLSMGPVIKLLYRFEAPLTPPHVHAIFAAGNPSMWWSPTHGRDDGPVVWTALASGDGAMTLLRLDEERALVRGLEALRAEVDGPVPEPVDARLVSWPDDPFARGGYSHVLPGHRGAREDLAAPTPPLYWAGEATAPEARAASVHGALLSGVRAANEVRRAMGLRRPPRTAAGGAPATSY